MMEHPERDEGGQAPSTHSFATPAAHLTKEWEWLWGALVLLLSRTSTESSQDPRLIAPSEEALAEKRRVTDQMVDASIAQGNNLPIVHLAAALRLTTIEVRALLLTLACEMHADFRALCKRIQPEMPEPGPTLELVHAMFAPPEISIQDFIAAFTGSPLVTEGMLRFGEGAADAAVVRLEGRVLRHLLGDFSLDPQVSAFLTVEEQQSGEPEVDWVELGRKLREPPVEFRSGLLIVLVGADTLRKRRGALTVSKELGRPLLRLDVGLIGENVQSVCNLVAREALLRQACILIENWEAEWFKRPEGQISRTELLRRFENRSVLIFLSLSEDPKDRIPWDKPRLLFTIPALSVRERETLWERHLANWPWEKEPANAAGLAGRLRLEEGQIAEALRLAGYSAQVRDPKTPFLTEEDLYTAARDLGQSRLAGLAARVPSTYEWEDLILPEDVKGQLREIVNRVNLSARVLGDWGLERTLGRRKGITALFVGPSGTGKTMGVQIMAGSLRLELYRIDLSGVVSKYVGETEKNLERIFAEANKTNAILFFDEADALFGRRSEVRDAQDRFANIEISYLLQRMEEYEGIAILASNRKGDMDEAFARRMDFTVAFPEPDERGRHRIWRRMFPQALPIADDVDLAFMARQFKMTGGNIRNIAVAGAFLAAAEDSRLTMRHLILATRREYQKNNRLCTQEEFGPYVELLDVRGSPEFG